MTHHLDRLDRPIATGTHAERAARASEDRALAVALRERAGVLRAGAGAGAALAIAELDEFAARLLLRAAVYEGGQQWSR